MRGAHSFLKKIGKNLVLVVLSCAILISGQPKMAAAVVPPALPVIDLARETGDIIKNALVNAAVPAIISGVNYLVGQLAYQAAVALTSECPGQKACWNSKSFGQFVRESAQGAIGEAIGTLSEEAGFSKLGFNLCAPPSVPQLPGIPDFNGAQFTLNLQLGLLDELKPPPPKCDFNQLVSNWDAAKNSLTSQDLLAQAKSFFEPGQSPLSSAISLRNAVNIDIAQTATNNAQNQTLIDASAGGGFSGITDSVSGRIKAPPAFVKSQFDQLNYFKTIAPQEAANASVSGQIARGAVATVVPTALSVFGQTLLSRLWNKMADGLLSTEALIAAQPDLILNADGVLQPPGIISTRIAQSRFFSTAPRDIGLIDPMLDFTTCPTTRGLKNCVVDAQFANAVRVADAAPLTIGQALGLSPTVDGQLLNPPPLHGEWPLISAKNRAKDQSADCYASAYCESNLKKLRAARIISIGWEIAASKSPVDKPVKLKEVVANFNNCNAQGQADIDHPWCHLIDPDWVLKIPLTQCRAQVYGPLLTASEIPNRGETCADAPTCLKQDEAGNCVGGYGYCTREKNIWRFNGDVCPAQFSSCRTLTQVTLGAGSDTQVNLLMNTVNGTECNADNAGCEQFSTRENVNDSATDTSDDWDENSLRFFNQRAENCSPSDGGCTVLFDLAAARLGTTQSLNLVRNGSFERLVDGDLDGNAEHADFWIPMGEIPDKHNGSISRDPANAIDGSVSIYLDQQNIGGVTSCDISGGQVCDQQSGCTCKTGGFSCAVAFGEKSCAIMDEVVQDGISIRSDVTYSLQATFSASENLSAAGSSVELVVYEGEERTLQLLPSQVTITPGVNTDCRVTPQGSIRAVATGSAPVQIPVCNFFISGTFSGTRYAALHLSGTGVFADSVQFEEGNPTNFHDGYGTIPPSLTAKVAPAYLGCSGDASNPAECQNYAPVCRASEVGCERYTPTNGDPAVPAIVSNADRCPAECVGYDSFRQAATPFDIERFPVHFIPATARQCSAAEVGCEEFTNTSNEQKAYFSQLRACQRPEAPDTAVYYSWEGSDTSGFQLRVWSFKASNITSPNGGASSPDIAPTATASDAGRAPCTNFNGQDGSCADTGDNIATCNRAAVDAGDLDCREFYDVDGNRHYRLLSRVVVAAADCETFRITTSNEDGCRATGGRWNDTLQQCTYATAVSQSVSCNQQSAGCRAYQGGTAGNAQQLFIDTFETNIDNWGVTSVVEQSPEAVVVGGHSLKIKQVARRAERSLTALGPNRAYTMSFWARGGGNLIVKLDHGAGTTSFAFADGNESTVAPQITLSPEWRQYTLGPVIFQDASFSNQQVFLAFETAAGFGDAFIDNVEMKEVRDNVFIVHDSWNTPQSCDQNIDGIPAPQEMLGCKAYTTTQNRTEFLRSFGNICRDQAVGCRAYSISQNSPQNFQTETFSAVCALPAACTGETSCPCNFQQRNPTSLAGSAPVVRLDVCRVPVGQTSCRFNMNNAFLPLKGTSNPDTVVVPTDERRFLVIREQDRCDASAASCTALGRPVNNFESGTAEVESWETVFKKDDPTKYSQILCGQNAIACKAFNGTDGQYFFKFDPAQTCEYKESVTVNGQNRSGWFRKTEAGTFTPCYPNLIQNGDYFDIAKNGDQAYQGFAGICQQEFDRCEEFIDPLDTSGSTVNSTTTGKSYYFLMNEKLDSESCNGSASLKDGCVLFNQTSNLSKTFSTSASYLKSEKERDGTEVTPENCNSANPSPFCAKRCSAIRNGVCINDNRIACNSDSQCPGAAAGSCRGDRYFGAGCTADIDCNGGQGERCVGENDPLLTPAERTQFQGFTRNDANTIIRVRPDRECGQWFACSSEQTIFDTQTNKWRSVCTGFDLCEENRQAGNAFECVRWVEPSKKLLSQNAYAERDVTWNGMDFSGYSIPNEYSASLIKPIKINGSAGAGTGAQTISSTRFGVILDPAFQCTTVGGDPNNNNCPPDETGNKGRCENKQCYYDITGGTVKTNTSNNVATCRAYPEIDAPYPKSILRDPFGNNPLRLKDRLIAFKGANVCEDGNAANDEACECGYKRLAYAGATTIKFVSPTTDDNAFPGICIGGPNSGEACNPDDESLISDSNKNCDASRGGTCARLESKATAVGWQGLCLDYDTSININGDPNKFACNTWMPVDQIAGAQDIFNQYKTAGFDGSDAAQHNLLYCQASAGSQKGNVYTQQLTDETSTQPFDTVDFLERENDRLWFYRPRLHDYSGTHTETLNVLERDVAGLRIEFLDEDSPAGASRPKETMYLLPNADPNKDWRKTVSWDSEGNNNNAGLGNAAADPTTGAVLGDSSINTNCLNILDLADVNSAETACENLSGKPFCLAAKANFSGSGASRTITNIKTGLCYKLGTGHYHYIRVRVNLLYREACTVMAQVHKAGRTISNPGGNLELSTSGGGADTWNSAPWTNRILNPKAVLPSLLTGYGNPDPNQPVSQHTTTRYAASEDSSPYGFGKSSTVSFSDPTGQPTYPVFASEGGSPFTTVVQNATDYIEKGGVTSAGTTFGCAGTGCKQLATASTDQTTAKTAGENRLSNLFAVSWFTFDSAAGAPYAANTTGGTNGSAWDRRISHTALTPTATLTGTPKVLTVDPTRCAAEGACIEGNEGITVNSTSSGSVEGEGGRLKVVIRFYGFADKDHMPIRRKVIDFLGDGHTATGVNSRVRTEGFYKNHRGVTNTGTAGQEILAPVCNGQTTEWGKTPESCDSYFFEESKTYLCSAAYRDTLPACTGNNYPCRRSSACVFKPKVQLLDNWGACNGICNGGACINTTLGIDNAGGGCSLLNRSAWTEFNGEIIVRP